MKVKGILKGKELALVDNIVLKKKEINVEVIIPDEDIELSRERDIKSDDRVLDDYRDDLIELIDNIWVDKNMEISSINYKEILGDILVERYNEKKCS